MASTQFGSDPIIAGTFVDLRGMPETYRQGYAAGVEDTKAKYAKLVEAALKVLLGTREKGGHRHYHADVSSFV